MACIQGIVPPHLLRGIAESEANPEHVRNAAKDSLAAHERINAARKERMAAAKPQGSGSRKWGIVPPHILQKLGQSVKVDEAQRLRAQQTDETTQQQLGAQVEASEDIKKKSAARSIYTAHHDSSEGDLPGKLVRAEGAEPVEDKSVNEAYTNVGLVLKFYKDQYDWKSYDDKNSNVVSSVHFVWDPSIAQMVFGDGDDFLGNFTGCLDVIGHEMTHAVTEHTSPLAYYGQPGALNESVSDVFGIVIKQNHEDVKADDADWLIGEDCILPGVKGTALRSMKAPGTAYNDPRFGKDPQVGNMDQYEVTFEDNGGVHIYSGIPNRAFYLTAVAFGGYSWEKAGRIWWHTMNSDKIPAKCSFKQFAEATIDIADHQFGPEASKKVKKAWKQVGVISGDDSGEWCKIF